MGIVQKGEELYSGIQALIKEQAHLPPPPLALQV